MPLRDASAAIALTDFIALQQIRDKFICLKDFVKSGSPSCIFCAIVILVIVIIKGADQKTALNNLCITYVNVCSCVRILC